MGRNIEFSIGEYYHLYARGTEKRRIFYDKQDYERFQSILYVCNNVDALHLSSHPKILHSEIFELDRGERLVDIGFYSQMPNHLHLGARERSTTGISSFMKKALTAYVMYFNKKYERTGRLFENSFRAKHIDNDTYLKQLSSYVHLNPVKLFQPNWKEKGLEDITSTKKFLEEFHWSSYRDYSGIKRPENNILNREEFPEYFLGIADFEESISEALDWQG